MKHPSETSVKSVLYLGEHKGQHVFTLTLGGVVTSHPQAPANLARIFNTLEPSVSAAEYEAAIREAIGA